MHQCIVWIRYAMTKLLYQFDNNWLDFSTNFPFEYKIKCYELVNNLCSLIIQRVRESTKLESAHLWTPSWTENLSSISCRKKCQRIGMPSLSRFWSERILKRSQRIRTNMYWSSSMLLGVVSKMNIFSLISLTTYLIGYTPRCLVLISFYL